MDLTMLADFLSSINPIVLGSVAGGGLIVGTAALYIKKNKNKFIENTDPLAQSNDFKTLKTEDLEREFGSLTVQTKILDEDESLFFDKNNDNKLKNDSELVQPSTKLVDEASVFDSFAKYDQALDSLRKSIEIEKHDKEKVRLKILLSQYNNKKGKESLDNIIKEYPSFHTKVSFGPNNTVSALMSSPVPKNDTLINKEIDSEFDIFADLPVLNESPKIIKEQVVISTPKDIFADIPSLEEHSTVIPQVETPHKNEDSIVFFESKENVPSQEHIDIFNELPNLENNNSLNNSNSKVSIESSSEIAFNSAVTPEESPVKVEEQFDQFSWTTSSNTVEDETEKMLKELQKDADKIDKINENEAIDDMQKFWKEFGNMVVDIKKDVESAPSDHVDNVKEPTIPEFKDPQFEQALSEPTLPHFEQTPLDDSPYLEKESVNPDFKIVKDEETFVPSFEEVKDNSPVENSVPVVEQNFVPSFEEVKDNSPVENSVPVVEQNFVPSFEEVKDNSPIESSVPVVQSNYVEPPLLKEVIQEQAVAPTTEIKPLVTVNAKPFKVWANWIVNIEGQQVFRNHFINLKNPWGSALAGEELYMGINKLSGKTPQGKAYPWVLVSVFPLAKE